MDWLDTAQQVLTLLTGLIGLVSTGISVYFAVKNFITTLKTKTKTEQWNMLMQIADAAMEEAEASGKSGADKKEMAIASIKASCKAAGIDADSFVDQLSSYIDNCIKFANTINANSTKS